MVKIDSVTAEIFLIWTNVAKTNVDWTNIAIMVKVKVGSRKLPLKFGQHRVSS